MHLLGLFRSCTMSSPGKKTRRVRLYQNVSTTESCSNPIQAARGRTCPKIAGCFVCDFGEGRHSPGGSHRALPRCIACDERAQDSLRCCWRVCAAKIYRDLAYDQGPGSVC